MTIAALQFRASGNTFEESLDQLDAHLALLGEQRAKLIVCPECAAAGYPHATFEAAAKFGEDPDGPTFQRLRNRAVSLGSHIVAGIVERHQGVLYNSAIVIDDGGQLLATYRKRELYVADLPWARPGAHATVVETSIGKIAIGICADVNADEFIQELKVAAPDIVAIPLCWLDEGIDALLYWNWRFQPLKCAIVLANTWGTRDNTKFYGRSAIFHGGKLVALARKTGDGAIFWPDAG